MEKLNFDHLKRESPQGKTYSTSYDRTQLISCRTCDDMKWLRPREVDKQNVKYIPCPDCKEEQPQDLAKIKYDLAGLDGFRRRLHT